MKKSLGPSTPIYPAPVVIVCTYDDAGKPNAMAAAWVGVACSDPPCISIALREATYTYGNILARQAFCASVPSASQVAQADFMGIASGRNVDKFAAARLSAGKAGQVDAPYVEEFPVVMECKLVHHVKLGLHTLFVGQVMDARADEAVLGDNGKIDMGKLAPLAFNVSSAHYHGVGEPIARAFKVGNDLDG